MEPVKQHDQIIITFPRSTFLLTSPKLKVYSVFAGTGTAYNRDEWNTNLFKGTYEQDTSYAYGQQAYLLDSKVVGNSLVVYGLYSELDPREDTGDNNYKFATLILNNVINPREKFTRNGLSFEVTHQRYTYNNGPLMKVHYKNDITFNDDLIVGETYNHWC